MDAEKIIQDLNRKFAAPLPEFYKRRIVVWHDEAREFIDKLDEIKLENAKIVALTGSNNFYVKKLLAVDDPDSNYLIYNPISYGSDEENNPFMCKSIEDNWLLDIELYSEEFRADLISMWMDEMNISQTPALRSVFKTYRKFFNSQSRRKKVASQKTAPSTHDKLLWSIMAAIAGLKEAKPYEIIKAVLKTGLQIENNTIYQEFVNYGIDTEFWNMVLRGVGFDRSKFSIPSNSSEFQLCSENNNSELTNKNSELFFLAAHLLLTASTRTMNSELLAGLDQYISTIHQSNCYEFVSDWIHSKDGKDVYTIATSVEDGLKLPQRFMKLELIELMDAEIFPCVNEVILVKLMTEIGNNNISVDTITQTVEKRRTCAWYDSVKNYYESILLVAKMQTFFKEYSAGFHTVEPIKIWKDYTTLYYVMDVWYRLFHKYYSVIQNNYNVIFHDRFNLVKDKVENLYVNWYLRQLGDNWSTACADNLREYGRILEIPQQTDFYQNYIAESDSKKIYVIISDAMRYEVATSLAEHLQRDTQANVKLKSMQGIFPTTTKFGMAALLPHKKLSVELKNGSLAVLTDGLSTEASNRDKVLKSTNPASVALRYKDIIDMKRTDRQALVKGMKVVYIYHDVIDEAGHSESSVFAACQTAIDEIKNLVLIIANEWGGINIVITSDHGFLYTHEPLKEDSKVDKTSPSSQDVEIERRHAIMKKGAHPQFLLPVKFLNGDTPYDAFAPRENIRIKKQGGGLNFVHGGISLQEMVVPVIEYRFLRNQSKEYLKNKNKYDTKPVEINLISTNRKISNLIFSLNFYQKDAVGGNREAATYQLYFTDSAGNHISDVQKIIADKTSDNGQDRIFRCSFNLKSLKYNNTETYYLVIADENGLSAKREEFQIDIAFAVDEFNFF